MLVVFEHHFLPGAQSFHHHWDLQFSSSLPLCQLKQTKTIIRLVTIKQCDSRVLTCLR
ncbi:hypothetical protein HanXRQr2_Chr11g0505871 [Helianthus annuus]|uniref:Uncharacterized protein n=1 Tax=Helianthus annuus TaxID=4232 RepID=A0A9K3N1A8_HELAN|nr:hypothetical protein HanXRQr2_Chr11g0505871 [Helianthus annuus]